MASMLKPNLIFCLHEIGLRKKQQDSVWPRVGKANLDQRIFLVCDGVGGAAKGEVASEVTSRILGEGLERGFNSNIDELKFAITNLVNTASANLEEYSINHAEEALVSTTLTLAILLEREILVSWCGDSRIIHIRKGEIVYQSADHSLVAELQRTGEITAEEARVHPRRNVITRSISSSMRTEVAFDIINSVEEGDYLILCSDGILENLTVNAINDLFSQPQLNEKKIESFFQELCHNKTNDNYSMYLLQLTLL